MPCIGRDTSQPSLTFFMGSGRSARQESIRKHGTSLGDDSGASIRDTVSARRSQS